jgi:hypothetical protein
MKRYVSEPIPIPELHREFEISRADLVFVDVDHSGPSWEGRVFLNAPRANFNTPREPAAGYAGSFFVFGHGACYGEKDHCDPAGRYVDAFDIRLPHPIRPITRTVIITNALKAVDTDDLVVTLVAAEHKGRRAAPSDALQLGEVRLLVYEP